MQKWPVRRHVKTFFWTERSKQWVSDLRSIKMLKQQNIIIKKLAGRSWCTINHWHTESNTCQPPSICFSSFSLCSLPRPGNSCSQKRSTSAFWICVWASLKAARITASTARLPTVEGGASTRTKWTSSTVSCATRPTAFSAGSVTSFCSSHSL